MPWFFRYNNNFTESSVCGFNRLFVCDVQGEAMSILRHTQNRPHGLSIKKQCHLYQILNFTEAHALKYHITFRTMSLSNFEIAVGGMTSIPTLGGLVFLSYKIWGERNLDASKLKPKKPQKPAANQVVKQQSEAKTTDKNNEKNIKTEEKAPTDASSAS